MKLTRMVIQNTGEYLNERKNIGKGLFPGNVFAKIENNEIVSYYCVLDLIATSVTT
jgi:hypothetical protein